MWQTLQERSFSLLKVLQKAVEMRKYENQMAIQEINLT